MLIDRYADDVVVWAPAKVNLFLEILGKRPDGYHEIATLMAAIRLYDTLVFKEGPAGAIHLGSSQSRLSTGPDNLIVRAAELLREHTGCKRGATIRLVKRIPLSAGLAGGSTDAAAALAGLNELWRLGLDKAQLTTLGARLGSDVPFFFGGPAAWCTGRGEMVAPLDCKKTLELVLLCPPFGLASRDVYTEVKVPANPASGEDMQRAVREGNVEAIGRALFNRLEEPAQRLCPELIRFRERLAHQKPAGVLMSGSGSTWFALCRTRAEARRVARQLRLGQEEASVYLVRSCPCPPGAVATGAGDKSIGCGLAPPG
jgi:4-diphosphocytidyl-2-C-methyl-D-erythritol kinase